MNRKRRGSKVFCSSKNGQVTIFIIIGIVLLFTFAGIMYFTSNTISQRVSSEGEPIIQNAPQAFNSIQVYTQDCLEQTAQDGILILGEQGGYIYPDLLGEMSNLNPTDQIGLNLNSVKIPYWHFNSAPNKEDQIIFASNKPQLLIEDDEELSIQAQLNRYIGENIDSCLNNYEAFTQSGFEVDTSEEKEISTIFSDEFVGVEMILELNARQATSSTNFDKFYVRVPIKLKHLYETADQIYQAQSDFQFLESQSMELISVFSRKDSNALPPTSGISYELFSPVQWHEGTVKEQFVGLLTSYVPMLRFLGQKGFYYSAYPNNNLLAQKVVDNMVLPLVGAQDLEISFDYFGWNPYFKTNSENGIIKPEHTYVNYEILTFGSQQYETHYDFSYPVLVTLNDESAFNGDGFNFVFALESNVRNNRPAEHDSTRVSYPRRTQGLFCEDNQKTSEIVRAIVVDSYTKEPIEEVKIGYSIPEDESCEIGQTNLKGQIDSKYPSAYGGIINFNKLDYLNTQYPVDTYNLEGPSIVGYAIQELGENNKVIEMHKIKQTAVTIKKQDVIKCVKPLVCEYITSVTPLIIPSTDIKCKLSSQEFCSNQEENSLLDAGKLLFTLEANSSISKVGHYYLTNSLKSLAQNEKVIVTLERIGGFNEEVIDQNYQVNFDITGNQIQQVDIVPGRYSMSVIGVLEEEFEIPSEKRCVTYDLLLYEQEECFDIEGQTSDKVITTSISWQTPQTYISITPQDLYSSSLITFPIPVIDFKSIPKKINSIQKECGGFDCLLDICSFSTCEEKTISINGIVVEDLQATSILSNVSNNRDIREQFDPIFS